MKIFCDFDDTLFKSSKRFIDIINLRYNICKSEKDIADWGYRSIYKWITPSEVEEIYGMDDFFVGLDEMDGAIDVIKNHDVIICTKGNHNNIENKKKFIKSRIPFIKSFISVSGSKGSIDMKGSVQIDDRFDNLECTNASIKILFKNFNNFEWQRCNANSCIYVVDTWEEIKQILNFTGGNLRGNYC